ncbi:hypothetical protein GCM10011531_24010 [Aquaticitalea lipolytica]|jgi:hypothetical protein|uniref:DUF3185 domain-containing protein n=1 Tax=Aquaticitalea lipolytica TaxID=1247562 RepID=A0A8J2XHX0_9FLAO|nr:hypothetical protein [Aquaticitalea lipolytica]GFZ91518.1 hypothetical protein GCM10011531_24010 [Aquaticitalea lipolytica]
MNKAIKLILLIVGLGLLGYGIYKLIIPETSVDIGIAEFEGQDNKDAYITIGLGLVAVVLSFLGGKKSA